MKAYWQQYQRERRWAKISVCLAQDLSVIEGGLRAGSSFFQALQSAAEESDGPLAEEWQLLLKEVRMGVPLPQALNHLETRLPIIPIQSLVSAILILQETGGNLASVLKTLARTLQEEAAFQGKLRTLTAQGKMSGIVVSAMPFLILGALSILTPDLARPLFVTSLGRLLLGIALVMMAIGGWWIKKIVTIEV